MRHSDASSSTRRLTRSRRITALALIGLVGTVGPAHAAAKGGTATAPVAAKSRTATAPVAGTAVLRLNVGGPTVTTGGKTWLADRDVTGGQPNTMGRTADITGTTDDVLYRSERWGTFAYSLPVPAASDYVVRLHFVEYHHTAAGRRVFSVNLEGGTVELPDYDIFREVGGMRASVKSYVVGVRDGRLDIGATATVDNAKLSAIEVLRSTQTTAPAPITAPTAPQGPIASLDAAAGSGTLAWTAPSSTGGSAITGYRVSRDGTDAAGTAESSTVLPATARSFTFGTLISGQTYRLSVQALNAVGASPSASVPLSIPAASVPTPSAPPAPTPAPSPAPTAPAAPARDVTLQPFASTSVWNLPIGTGAQFESPTDPRTANLIGAGGVWANEGQYSHPVTRATTSDPLAVMTDTTDASRSGTYRIPSNAPIAAGSDAHLHVIAADGRTVDEAWAVTRHSPTSYSTGRHHTIDLHGTGTGPRNGTRAYGGSAIGGLIRAWEVDPTHPSYTGAIKHPIAIALRNDQLLHTGGGVGYNPDGTMMQSGYVWPATEQDWDSPWTYSGKIPMGSYVAIPPTVDLAGLGLTRSGLMLARAYQDYGAYVTDRAGDMILAYVEPSQAGSAFATPLLGPSWTAADLHKIRTHLRLVTNNTSTNPNGTSLTGPRRAPLLP